MRQSTRGGRQQPGGGRRGYVPPKQSNPVPIIAGIGGGVLVLIIIIAVATSGGEPPPPEPPPQVEAAPAVNVGGRTVADTGVIVFICANSSHPDQEVEIRHCGCGARGRFFAEGGSFYCFKCKKPFPSANVKCDQCGKQARRSRIKRKG